MLDVDGLDAEGELRKLEAANGALPASVETITGRGRHVYLKWPGVPVRNSAGKLAPGLDIRGDGGYVVCPPSVHPSGRRTHGASTAPARLPTRPLGCSKKYASRTKSSAAPPAWRELAAGGVAEGERNSTITKLAGYLLRRYVEPGLVLELLRAFNATRCTPPLPAADVRRIVDSICGAELKRRHRHG